MKTIVLITKGKRESLESIEVRLFDRYSEAEKFCNDNNDDIEEKYWTYCDIIKDGKEYNPARYENFEVLGLKERYSGNKIFSNNINKPSSK
jgi:hypothetical protein